MLTFVVYYRIHLNLNLEASARQWPNNFSHPLWENPTPKPRALMRFLSSWIQICFMDMNNCLPKAGTSHKDCFRLCSISIELDWLWRLIERSWAFIPQKRLIHSGANGFKPDNVPLSLRDTGYCHSDHKVSLPATKWLSLTPSLLSALLFQDITKIVFMFTNLDWTLQGDRNSTSSTVLSCFRVNFPFSQKPLPSHPCSLLNIYIQLQYICV